VKYYLCDPAAMTRSAVAVAAFTAALTLSALPAQDKTANPCPSDTAQTKLKKGLAALATGKPVAPAVSQPNPCPPPPAGEPVANAAPLPAPTQNAAPPASPPSAPQIAAAQPKPGTSRIVHYQGKDIAIATGTDENGKPRTYVILPSGGREVRLTTNPDVYVSVATPPTTFTVDANSVLTITEPAKSPEITELHTGVGSQMFHPRDGGDVITIEDMHLVWYFRPGFDLPHISVQYHEQAAFGAVHSFTCGYEGHDAQGIDYVNCSQGKRYRIAKQGARVSMKETELPEQLDKDLGGK
jgi:hypothetical protein